MGWLFRKVDSYVRPTGFAGEGSDRAPQTRRGQLEQAFSAALQDELADYYRLIAVLEAQLKRPSSASGAQLSSMAATWSGSFLTLPSWILH